MKNYNKKNEDEQSQKKRNFKSGSKKNINKKTVSHTTKQRPFKGKKQGVHTKQEHFSSTTNHQRNDNLTRSNSVEKRSSMVRLQKFLSECGVASRRESENIILQGRVTVNGAVVQALGAKIDPYIDKISVDNKALRKIHKGVLLLHKPMHVLTTMYDPEGRKCIADMLTKQYKSYFPVGRLDYTSTGLVVMTNDGDLADILLHPRYTIERIYTVKVKGSVRPQHIDRIHKGINLDDGIANAKAVVKEYSDVTTTLEVTLTSGRNRVIRRMMKKLGLVVTSLHRIQHGPLKIGRLKKGEIRKLTQNEYESLKKWLENIDKVKPKGDF
jgi:23S rRNA pseudouridine2605 synthase